MKDINVKTIQTQWKEREVGWIGIPATGTLGVSSSCGKKIILSAGRPRWV